MPKKPTVEPDQGFVEHLDSDYLQCRSLRHAWKLEYFGTVANAPTEVRTQFSPGVLLRQTVCMRCGTRKEAFYAPPKASARASFREQMASPFFCFYSRYRHPQGYLWKGHDDSLIPPELPDYHKELFTRFEHNAL
jgi:hypothetical protein